MRTSLRRPGMPRQIPTKSPILVQYKVPRPHKEGEPSEENDLPSVQGRSTEVDCEIRKNQFVRKNVPGQKRTLFCVQKWVFRRCLLGINQRQVSQTLQSMKTFDILFRENHSRKLSFCRMAATIHLKEDFFKKKTKKRSFKTGVSTTSRSFAMPCAQVAVNGNA